MRQRLDDSIHIQRNCAKLIQQFIGIDIYSIYI
jgi:hypothetical protein